MRDRDDHCGCDNTAEDLKERNDQSSSGSDRRFDGECRESDRRDRNRDEDTHPPLGFPGRKAPK